jgi:hypothetical protein
MQAVSDPSIAGHDWHFDPPEEISRSPLLASGGYLVVRGLFDEETLQGLSAEADVARAKAERMLVADSDGTEGRGGFPARAYLAAPSGDLHWGLHGCQQMAETLRRLCGFEVFATGGGTYSYYDQAGDFLAVHRDVLQCDVAVITSLTPCSVDGSTGELVVYPEFIQEPLSAVRAAGRASGTSVPLDRGHTIILLGGILPHEVAPTCSGQERIVSINCYRAQTADQPADLLEPDPLSSESAAQLSE